MHRHNLFTSNSRKILMFFFKLAVLLGILLGFMLYISPQYSQGYCASMIDKVNRLKSIEGPKIVLIGDSNLAFGIKSEEIEAAFSMPVVNMGIHSNLRTPFNEQMVRLNIQEGDIYIICDAIYADNEIYADLAWITIEDHFELWRLLRWEDIIPMVRAYPAYFKACVKLWLNDDEYTYGVYRRDAFNEYGDLVGNESTGEYIVPEGSEIIPPIGDRMIESLNELSQYLDDCGATMLIAACPVADSINTPPKEEYDTIWEDMSLKLDAPIISDFKDYFYPETYFYDTPYHLNTVGKEVRTRQLISDLRGYFTSLGS